MGKVLALILNSGNTGLITTHSPYILGTFNYLLLAGQVPANFQDQVKKQLRKRYWIDSKKANAYYICNGFMDSAIDEEDGLKLVKNELIDSASSDINEMSDFLLEFLFTEEENHDN